MTLHRQLADSTMEAQSGSPPSQQQQSQTDAAQRLCDLHLACMVAGNFSGPDFVARMKDRRLAQHAQKLAAGHRTPIPGLYLAFFLAAAVLGLLEACVLAAQSKLALAASVGNILLIHLGALETSGVLGFYQWAIQCSRLWWKKNSHEVVSAVSPESRRSARLALVRNQYWCARKALSAAAVPVVVFCWIVAAGAIAWKFLPARHVSGVKTVMAKVPVPAKWCLCASGTLWFGHLNPELRPLLLKAEEIVVFVLGTLIGVAILAGQFLFLTALPWLFTGSRSFSQRAFNESLFGVAFAALWLQRQVPVVQRTVRHIWAHMSNVLWLLVAVILISFPWQYSWMYAHLEGQEKGLAVLPPLVQLAIGHLLLEINMPELSGAAGRALSGWVGRVLTVQHALAVALAVNWLALTAAAIVSTSIFTDGNGNGQSGGWYLGSVRVHLLAHFVLTGAYALLQVAPRLVIASQPVRAIWGSLAASLCRLRCCGMVCSQTARVAVIAVFGKLCGLLACAWRCAQSCAIRCLSLVSKWGFAAVRTPTRLLPLMVAAEQSLRGSFRRCVTALLHKAVAAPTAALGPLASVVQACLATARAAACSHTTEPSQQTDAAVISAPSADAASPVATAPSSMCRQHLQSSSELTVPECVVCFEARRSVLLLPCRHILLCDGCFEKVQQQDNLCPMCRTECTHHVGGLIIP